MGQRKRETRRPVGRLLPGLTRGGEHQVFFQKTTRRYVKATLQSAKRAMASPWALLTVAQTPSEYLDRLDLQNRIFEDNIRLERIVIKNDKPIIVTSQPAIKGVAPTPMALDD